MNADMNGKTVLVTGASAGIGFATAMELARMRASLVLVCRTRERGEKAREAIIRASGNTTIELMVCDLASQKQIRALAAEFKSRRDKLHVLINNAAVVPAQRTLTEDGVEMQFAVNHLAYFLLTNLLLDPLKAGASSRIVNVASGMHFRSAIDYGNLQAETAYKAMKHYGLMKLLNILFTSELARRLEGTGVTANCLSPGFTATDLGRDFSPFSRFVMRTMARKKEEGARTVIYLAASPEVASLSGKYFSNEKEVRSSKDTQDIESARRLWEISAKMTDLG
jgi:NAD(P)-dependent dehydrogenase (short-subunit alcohol dehydrogenase family)